MLRNVMGGNIVKKASTIDMVNGPLLPNIINFALPLMAMNFLQMLFNAADTIVVGKYAGQAALAAVGATGSLIFLLTSLFNGLSMGTNVVIAQAIGAGEKEKISKSVHTSIVMAIISGVVLSIVGVFAAKSCLELMATPIDIINQSTIYMQIYFLGSLFMIIYNFGAAILRSKGDTKRPLYFLIISGLINVVLNLIFVIVFHWDVFGVAFATVISQAVSCALVIYTLLNESDAIKLEKKKLKMDLGIAKEIINIGVPAGIQGMAFSLSNVVVQSSINSFDSSIIVAGNSAASNIENFVYIGMMAFSSATITFTSQYIGAKKYDGVKKIMWLTMVLNAISAIAVGFLAWYFGNFFLRFYTDSPEVVEVGLIRLFWVAMFLVLNGILDIFINSMRGMGHSNVPTIIMIGGVCGVRLAWLLLYFPLNPRLEVIYMCYPLSWIITAVFEAILWYWYYLKLKKKINISASVA